MFGSYPQYPTVQLTSGQLQECREAAAYRELDTLQRGLGNARPVPKNAAYIYMQEISYMAELALPVYLGVPPQTGVGQMGQPDLIYKGYEIDVKTSTGICPNLNIEPAQLHPNRIYAFITGDATAGKFALIGYIKGEDIPQKGELTDYGYNHRPKIWKVKRSDLTPFKERPQ